MKRTTISLSESGERRVSKKARGSSSSSSESEESFIAISADTSSDISSSSESSDLETTTSSSSSGEDDPIEIIEPVQEEDNTIVINPPLLDNDRQDRVVIINPSFSSSFFGEKPAPLTHDPNFAIYVLDAEYDGADNDVPVGEDAVFSRSLRSYPFGTIVKKCHGPWGNNRVLENRYFTVKNSVFSSEGVTTAIILESTCSEAFVVVLNAWFFDGWLDQVAVDTHDYFLSCQ